ncbi:MAG: protein TolR [Alphaproteobacteria bacterium]|nr:protein TolR [Alphaproteobacteria bacterium]
MGASLSGNGRSRGRRSGGSYRPMAEINVTPLVDVMLVLLIVFMVAAPLLTAGVAVDLPSSQAKPMQQEDNRPIEVTIDAKGLIFIGESVVEEGRLVPLLQAMTEGQEDRRIYIRGDQSLDYGKIMSIIGAVNAAGFNKVALISENKK